jgi:micrococcal nuclease
VIILIALIVALVLGNLRASDEGEAGAEAGAATSVTEDEEAGGGGSQGAGSSAGAGGSGAVPVTLVEVVDGDTIRVQMPGGSEEKVRYIGIDSPELPHDGWMGERLADEAKAHNADLLASGPVRLETDVELRDEFGRLLAYVWAGDVFVNEQMVLDGYAWAHDYPPNLTRQDRLWSAHDRARAAGVGVWQ